MNQSVVMIACRVQCRKSTASARRRDGTCRPLGARRERRAKDSGCRLRCSADAACTRNAGGVPSKRSTPMAQATFPQNIIRQNGM